MALEEVTASVMSRMAARLEAEDVLIAYGGAIDRGDFDAWADMFDPSVGSYRLSPRGNVAQDLPVALISCPGASWIRDRATSILHASVYSPHQYRHLYGNISAGARDGDRVELQAHYAVFRTSADGDTDLFSVGSVHAFLRTGSATAPILSMDVTYDTERIPGLLVFPL